MARGSKYFPAADAADAEGLVGIGGSLSPEWLLDAYRHGIFPWPCQDFEPVLWWSPDPRAVLEFEQFHLSRRMQRTLRSGKFTYTLDTSFREVITNCGSAPSRRGGTWLTPEMIAAYCRMQELGWAHSVETWLDGNLVGGTYGLAIGGLFAAESMFSLVSDASKAALAHLVSHLREHGYTLLDIQQLTTHTASLGATEIPRREYLRRVRAAVDLPVRFNPSLAT
jgi:leucyl/phenylalanyl-tRNA---protein transferase